MMAGRGGMPGGCELAGYGVTRKEQKEKSSALKLHAKDVPRIVSEVLLALPCQSEYVRSQCKTAHRALSDPSFYDRVPKCTSADVPLERMTRSDDVDTLLAFGVIERVAAQDVCGGVEMFTLDEVSKNRRRAIKFTRTINESLGKETLLDVRLMTKKEIVKLPSAGTHFIALDFAAYFDQFLYAEEIRNRMCFARRLADGTIEHYRLRVLAMGQRQAVEVASWSTELLLDFAKESTASGSVIDNIIFVGSREQVLHDARIFVERVRAVGALLNEDVDDLESLVQERGDWCGVTLDLSAKTVALTEKVLNKTRLSWENRFSWTWRTFAGHIGLLFWSWGILDVPMADYFALLRFISEAGRRMTDAPDAEWDAPAALWPSVWPVLDAWTSLALRNTPRAVQADAEPDWLICTDASRWGWGYVALCAATGDVRSHGERRSAATERDHGAKLGRSTFAEPQAILNTCCHLLTPAAPKRVRIGTDNTVAQAAYTRGFNTHSFDINECLRRLRDLFGAPFVFDFLHVPGVLNIYADRASRGQPLSRADDEQAACSLRRLLGQR